MDPEVRRFRRPASVRRLLQAVGTSRWFCWTFKSGKQSGG